MKVKHLCTVLVALYLGICLFGTTASAANTTLEAHAASSAVVQRTSPLPRPQITLSSVASSGKIKVSWEPVEGAVEYEVYRATSKTGTYTKMLTTSKTSYINTSAKAGKTYYYKVKAIHEDPAANSPFSSVKYRTCDLPRPEITSLTTSPYSGKPSLSWNPVEGASGYRIYRASSPDGTYTQVGSTTKTTFTNTSTEVGKTYYYKVMATHTNSGANSARSAAKSVVCALPQPQVTLSTVASSGKIKVSWKPVEGAVGYEVYCAASATGEYTMLLTTSDTNCIDTSAKAGTTYYYKVKAIHDDPASNSAFSTPRYCTCDLPRPEITSLTTSPYSGKPSLSWNPVEGASGYRVYRASSPDGTYTQVGTITDPTDTTFTNTSTEVGKTYYYKVMATHANSAAHSARSAAKSVVCALPQPQVTLSTVASSGKIKVSWKPVEGAVGYEVYCAASATGEYTMLLTTSDTSCIDTSAKAGTPYYYKVKAIHDDPAANSAFSTPRYCTCDLPRPEITSLTTSPFSGKPSLAWNPVEGASGYRVYRASSPDGTYTQVGSTTKTTFTNTSTEVGKTYYYKVMATHANSAAHSARSAAKSVVCALPQPQVTLSTVASSGKIKVSWKPVEGAVGYEVYCAASATGEYTMLLTTSDTSCIHTDTEAGIPYYYKVKAIHEDPASNSAFSTPRYCTCDLPRPEITSLTTSPFSGKPSLAWNPVEGASGYRVYRASTPDGTYTQVGTITDPTDTTFTNTSTEAGTTYYYKVMATHSNSGGHSARSAAKSVVCALAKPTISGSLNADGNPEITWEALEGAAAYNVYRSTEKEGNYTLVGTSDGAAYVDTQVEPDTTYYYKVEATHSTPAANSVISNPVKVHTPLCQTVYVKINQVTLYETNDSSSESFIIPYMTQVYLDRAVSVSENGSWYRVYYQNQPYYVWLDAGTEKFTDTRSDFIYKGNTPYQQQVLDLAMTIYKEWDTVYAHEQSTGVMNPDGTYGFDCSGLASYLLNTVMQKDVPTYRLTSAIVNFYETDSIYNAGYQGEFCAFDVAFDDLQPGDILFFNQESPIDHCGIYLGNGEFIHASTHWNRVTIMPLSGSYIEDLACIRRYLPEEVTPANATVHTNVSYAKLYTKMADSSDVIRTLGEGEEVTLLYTNNGNWSYVRTADGTCGYVLIKYLEP